MWIRYKLYMQCSHAVINILHNLRIILQKEERSHYSHNCFKKRRPKYSCRKRRPALTDHIWYDNNIYIARMERITVLQLFSRPRFHRFLSSFIFYFENEKVIILTNKRLIKCTLWNSTWLNINNYFKYGENRRNCVLWGQRVFFSTSVRTSLLDSNALSSHFLNEDL
jgi:hypothetical protein